MLIEWNAPMVSRRFGTGQRDPQDRIGPQMNLIRGSVQLDQEPIDSFLIKAVLSQEYWRNDPVDMGNRLLNPFPEITFRIFIPEFQSLMTPCGCPGRNGGPTRGMAFEKDLRFDRWISPRVNDLPSDDLRDGNHSPFSFISWAISFLIQDSCPDIDIMTS